MNNERRNLLGIIGQWIAIALMLVGIIWVFATQNTRFERVVEDVAMFEAQGAKTANDLTNVEKAVILIQNDMGHIKTDIAEILVTQKAILGKLE